MRTTATMTIYRTFAVEPLMWFFDGNGFDSREDEQELEVDISGEVWASDPNFGIMSGECEDICAAWTTPAGIRVDIELTDKEIERAAELLCDDDFDDGC